MIDISIIIPCFNGEKCISKLLDSILFQDLTNVEILIVNDGSTDNSLFVIKKYATKSSAIKIINQENQGVSEARNNGIKNASGKYIICFDADDTITDNAISFFKKKIISDENLYAFNYDCSCRKTLHQKSKNYSNRDFLKLFLRREISCGVYSLLIKKDFLLQENIYYKKNQKFGEDYLYIFSLLEKVKFVNYDDSIIYHYIVNRLSVSNNNSFNAERINFLIEANNLLNSLNFGKLKINQCVNFFLADILAANLMIYCKSSKKDFDFENRVQSYRKLFFHLFFCKFKYWLRIRFFTILPLALCKKILSKNFFNSEAINP